MAATTFRTTYRCGHTTERHADTPHTPGGVVDSTCTTLDCMTCEAARVANVPLWRLAGYASEAAYQAAVEHQARVADVERAREAWVAELAAMPEAERPFTTRPPMHGRPTLDDVAHEDFGD
jgi:hypothetical protein